MAGYVDPLIGMSISFAPAAPDKDEAPRGGVGSQVLPVADLEPDFDGAPEDGLEYLFLVRREAFAQPTVSRVENPYVLVPQEPTPPPTAPLDRPSEAWRAAFLANFIALRSRIATPPLRSTFPSTLHLPPPNARDEAGWKTYIHGKRRAPTVAIVQPAASTTSVVVPVAAPANEENEMTDAELLEQAKVFALASLELDAPDIVTPASLHTLPPSHPAPVAVETAPPNPIISPVPTTIPQSVDGYDPDFLPQSPSPALLLDIPQPTLIHLLQYLNDWLLDSHDDYTEQLSLIFSPSTTLVPTAVRRKKAASTQAPKVAIVPKKIMAPRSLRPPVPTAHEGAWIMSLLSALSSLLSGDDISTLRTLAKTVLILGGSSLRALTRYEAERGDDAAGMNGAAAGHRVRDEEDAEGRARCWMVVAVIAGVWGQTDLWNEVL